VLFLLNTAHEWYDLIFHQGLTLGTNLFGTTFFTLVGFHAAHVTMGVIIMGILLSLVLSKRLLPAQAASTELFSWYWHFVDVVWVGILLMVYILGR
jgi:cytochrome c oxidase subunit 3